MNCLLQNRQEVYVNDTLAKRGLNQGLVSIYNCNNFRYNCNIIISLATENTCLKSLEKFYNFLICIIL